MSTGKRSQIEDVELDMSSHGLSIRPDNSMDIDTECGGSATNNRIVHSGKRPRISDTETLECPPKIPGIKNLPIELFIVVARYLRPGDLLSLARCCKSFRSRLMNKSYQFLWLDVMKNVASLPPCPLGFTEPQYLTVLFSGFCTACGSTRKSKMDPILLVRLCDRCQKQCLVRLFSPQVPADVYRLIHKSNVFGRTTTGELPEARVLKSNLVSVLDLVREVRRSGNDRAVIELEKKLVEAVEERRMLSEKIIRAVEQCEDEVFWEKQVIQHKRRLEIQRRCIDELGFQMEDLQFSWNSSAREKYYRLLNKPELLYDREWREIRSHLKRLINANRKARLAKEREACEPSQSSYQGGVGPLVLDIDPVMDGPSHIERIEILGEI
ncbi:hypothetical protein RSOLAG22IIIB_05254 [Rhizoctonia solani]|uniref:F-box domain-containing protein n=1 Tax=Rhizoctonia solani TaxID=456999 RepID=A0A0K6G464_9AGAM|nr:hypothetical protein RSOLAG22IIIB_05254 [Rhizoctonia solani]